MERTFIDFYHNRVTFSTEDHPFSNQPQHVWVVSQYLGNWLLTIHPSRGLEFPGGKVESGETAVEAAKREVFEETGGVVADIQYIGQYKVEGKHETIVKNVYFARINNLITKSNYYETKGPKIIKKFPDGIKTDREYSYIMKDDVLPHSLKEASKRFSKAKESEKE